MTMAVVSRHDRIHRPNDRVVLRSAAENLFSVSSNQTERTRMAIYCIVRVEDIIT